jgi:hypothetical protein
MRKAARRKPASSAAPAPEEVEAKPRRGSKKAAKKGPTRREWLALKPDRNPRLEWREEAGVVVIEIHRAQNWKTKLLNLVFPLPESHRVALDAIGSIVWRAIDGNTTVEEVAKKLARELQLERREAELSLQQFFKELGRRGYIGFKIEAPSDQK